MKERTRWTLSEEEVELQNEGGRKKEKRDYRMDIEERERKIHSQNRQIS